jgi:diguanylate cyclase (GGDEF)-like protein
MNQVEDKTGEPVTGVKGKLARVSMQARALRSGLAHSLHDLVRENGRGERDHATPLVEANEALLLAALASQADAETAALALKNAPRFAALDALTQLPTRTMLLDRFDQAVAHAKRRGWRFAVLFLDLDNFKSLNDVHGHAFGDDVLRRVAESLVSAVRDEDTVSRHGGDEFIVLLTELSQPSDALVIAEKLIAAVSAPAEIRGHAVCVTASVGIALYPDDGEDADTLIALADAAMYESKRQGGGGVATHDAAAIRAPGRRAQESAPPTNVPAQPEEHHAANLERRLEYLREANGSLVLAVLSAQESQAAAEAQLKGMAQGAAQRSDGASADGATLQGDHHPIDIAQVMDKVVALRQPMFAQRSQRFESHIPLGILTVRGDEARLEQVFSNLVETAATHTREGGRIGLSIAQTGATLTLTLTVSDDGIGVTPQVLHDAFEPFMRDTHTFGFGGTGVGIGLLVVQVVQVVVQAHGGSHVAHRADADCGSRFGVTLPLATTGPIAAAEGSAVAVAVPAPTPAR